MTARELKRRYLDFFVPKGHQLLPNVSLVPEHNPTVLFTTAGMHPLVPYLLGEPHPLGKRLVSVQRCLRTDDIEEVGDKVHHTFFEMLGNWSLGDYWKKETISWSFEFLTFPEWLGIDKNRLAVSVFAGDSDAPFDKESWDLWRSLGISEQKIAKLPKKDNWWGPAGESGPCGPDTEMFVWTGSDPAPKNFDPKDSRWVEVWNDVFMEYNKTKEGKFEPLSQKNVDTGMGLERMLAVLNGFDDDYQTELFRPIIQLIEAVSGQKYEKEENKKPIRIIADHLRAAVFLIGDGVLVSNVGQGYILRRLIRRAITTFEKIKTRPDVSVIDISDTIVDSYKEVYPHLKDLRVGIKNALKNEEMKFWTIFSPKRAQQVESEIIAFKNQDLPLPQLFQQIGRYTFNSLATYGVPPEYTLDKAVEQGLIRTQSERFEVEQIFKEELKKHQGLSRTASAGMFKGGLSEATEITTKYHTATHLLHAALRQVLGEHVQQKGSNITPERLRFDFSHPESLTEEQLKQVEDLVNEKTQDNLPVVSEVVDKDVALRSGTLGFFGEKYGEKVTVYTIGDFSKEICGGPHVDFTGSLGKFKIIKEKAAAAGIRRIYAALQ